jgi:hypothetical protein
MFTEDTGLYKKILTGILIMVLAMGIMILIVPPSLYPDPSWGFQVMRAMQLGGGFNLLPAPDQDNIAKNTSEFLTWWSPGQYLVPYVFKSVLSINTGHASAITITLCQLSGLAGLYCFFRKIGFTKTIIALSLALVICQHGFTTPYIFYNGGEIILFGFIGWFLFGCATFNKVSWQLLLFVLLSGWIGFICKSSFIWMYLAGLLCLWIKMNNDERKIWPWIKNGLFVAIPAIISIAGIYVLYLSKNQSPASSAAGGLQLSWQAFSFPLASPLLSGLSVDDLFHGLIFHPSNQGFLTPFYTSVVISILALVSFMLVIWIILNFVPKHDYRLFIIVFYTAAVVFFAFAYTRQLNISYESRHFRTIGLLVTPGIIYFISKSRKSYRVIFGLMWIVIAGFSYWFFIKGYVFNIDKSAHGNSGFSQEYIDQPSLNYIMAIDKQNKDAIFAFTSPDLGLEIEQNRILTLDMPAPGTKFDYEDYSYDGHAGPLFILLPANYAGDKADMIMKFFPAYTNFSSKKLSGKYILYAAR